MGSGCSCGISGTRGQTHSPDKSPPDKDPCAAHMINFRYHLVSLVAVFLALGVGVTMGSTVIDQTIVEGLRGTIDRVEKRASTDRKHAQRSARERDAAREAFAQATPALLEHRLDGVTVVVVAGPDSEPEPVGETVGAIRAAGGIVPAVIELEPGWELESDGFIDRLGGVVGRSGLSPVELQALAVDALAERLGRSLERPGGASGPAGADPIGDVLARLRAAGLVSFRTDGGGGFDLAAYPPAGARFLLVDGATPAGGGADRDSASSGAAAGEPLMAVLSRALDGLDAPVAVASTSDADHTLAAAVRSIREGDLATAVTTIDEIERVESRAAVVLGLQDLASGGVGHYGVGAGARRQVPE